MNEEIMEIIPEPIKVDPAEAEKITLLENLNRARVPAELLGGEKAVKVAEALQKGIEADGQKGAINAYNEAEAKFKEEKEKAEQEKLVQTQAQLALAA